MVTHLLKLIRSRLGGSCWILVELLVVFVILWFMMYYFVAQGMLTRMPVGFKLCLLYTSPSPRDVEESRMPSSA